MPVGGVADDASMKAPPKRKGNATLLRLSPYIFGCLNESPSQKEGKKPPETSPQPCGRNGYHARTSRQAHTKSIPKPAYTRPNIRDKPKHHASDTPYLRHVPGSRAQTKTPSGSSRGASGGGSSLYKLFDAVHAFTLRGFAASGDGYSDSPSMPSRANAVKRDTARKYFF